MLRVQSLSTLALVLLPALALGQSSDGATSLAKKTQNPVADLVSIPFQFNYYTGGGLGGESSSTLNFQPVLPLPIGKRWNIISRTIVPYVNAPALGNERLTGIGDIAQQFFFTPTAPSRLIWGFGPMFSFPTATNDAARTGDWGLGPTAVALTMTGPWVIGALASQLWAIADDGEPDVNVLSIQPFVNFNLADGWAISYAPIMLANWKLDNDQWTIPVGLGISKVTAIGKQPISLGLQYYNNVARPETSGSSQLRFVASLLYPTAK